MEILQAEEQGFCFGVRRAIELVEKAAKQYGSVETLGAIVHNQQVVDRLQSLGVLVCDHLDEVKGKALAVTSHGVSPQVMDAVRAMDSTTVIDTTCPFVRKCQHSAKHLMDAGFAVVIYGDPNHPEVRGVMGWAGGKAIATTDWEEALTRLGKARRLGLVSQTTQSLASFSEFTKHIVDNALETAMELRVVNTICDATSRRQKCALEIARDVDIMVVIGGKNSANTRHLAQICGNAGVVTFHIETADELAIEWFAGRDRVGVTAGASTPDWVIQDVVERISALGNGVSQ